MAIALKMAAPVRKPDTRELLGLDEYDIIAASCSGGKDSLALVLDLLERGVPPWKIQLWHQHVDGLPGVDPEFMDWPCTQSYVQAVANVLRIPLFFQWREGGFLAEMLKEDVATLPIGFDRQDGTVGHAGGLKSKVGTRRRFPQKTGDLRVRWCSAVLKIDVAALAINNEPAFKGKKILFLTGERREEGRNGTGRALYAEKEPHRCDTQSRRVDAWRSVIDWSEEDVWAIMERWGIVPHPAYRLGFPRVSCMTCIFGGPDQWASVRAIAPEFFNRIACYEMEFGSTIDQRKTVVQMADAGTPYPETANKELVKLAMSRDYPQEMATTKNWTMPSGAFRMGGGPT